MKSSYSSEELIQCGNGQLFGEGNAQLPTSKMLMIDRIVNISENGGSYNCGNVIAELDIHPDLWFFDCHFLNDPIMPGCLELEAMWQLVGFFLGWRHLKGKARALGVGEVKFKEQVLRSTEKATYEIHIKRIIVNRIVLGIADGAMYINNKSIYTAKDVKVGLFHSEPSALV